MLRVSWERGEGRDSSPGQVHRGIGPLSDLALRLQPTGVHEQVPEKLLRRGTCQGKQDVGAQCALVGPREAPEVSSAGGRYQGTEGMAGVRAKG